MPITIDGSGTITGLSAGGLPDSSIVTADIANAAITAAKLDGAQSGSAPIYAARAWVNFNGTGTVAIRASGNVSSITDNGTGDYTVNFTTAISDANYSAIYTARIENAATIINETNPSVPAKSTGSIRLLTFNSGIASVDAGQVNVSIFR